MEEESSARAHICSSSSYVTAAQPLSMVQLPLTANQIKPEMPDFDTNLNLIQVEPQQQLPFPLMPQPQPELAFSPESRQALATLEDPYPFSVFGVGPHETGPAFFDPASTEFQNPQTPDIFFDDFPTDMFDNIEQLPSP